MNKRPYLRLLVDRQHLCMGRRIDILANDGRELLGECWFFGELNVPPAMRAETVGLLPDDIELLKKLVLEARQELARSQDANTRLWETLRQLQRAQFGRKSEKLDPDQFNFGMEETEQALAESQTHADDPEAAPEKKKRSVNRGALPAHLPREEIVLEPENKSCPCCGSAMHVMGEDRSERLDVVPAQFKVIVTRRPKYACRACEEAVVQAPAPAHLIEGGIPTESLIAHVLVSKYADHCPLYRLC